MYTLFYPVLYVLIICHSTYQKYVLRFDLIGIFRKKIELLDGQKV